MLQVYFHSTQDILLLNNTNEINKGGLYQMITRKDNWSEDDDSVLTSTVLNHIRNGSTQLAAFDEVGERLHRTSAACGFRWNGFVRKQYEKQIKEAKQMRMMKKSQVVSVRGFRSTEATSNLQSQFDAVISWMMQLQKLLDKKDNEIAQLQQTNEEISQREFVMSEDYKTLLDILKRAREIGGVV
jgi:RsfA family transcription factor